MKETLHPSRSDVQKQAEVYMIGKMAERLKLKLEEGCPNPDKISKSMSEDGYCITAKQFILCEAYARIGTLKGNQPDKVMMDALK